MGLLTFLEAHGLPAAIATSSDAEYTAFSLRCAGLSGRLQVVVTRDWSSGESSRKLNSTRKVSVRPLTEERAELQVAAVLDRLVRPTIRDVEDVHSGLRPSAAQIEAASNPHVPQVERARPHDAL